MSPQYNSIIRERNKQTRGKPQPPHLCIRHIHQRKANTPITPTGLPQSPCIRKPDTHIWVVAANHLPIGHLVAQAVRGLVRIHRHVQHIRGMHRQDGVSELGSMRKPRHC
jgi:hypothetical protein